MFDLDDFIVCGTTKIVSRQPLRVKTPPKSWEYAIAFPVDEDQMREFDGPTVVTVSATVHVGRVGFGLVTADMATYLGEVEQTFVSDLTPPIVLPSASAGRSLVVRNCADDGIASEVTLHGITVAHAGDVPNRNRVLGTDDEAIRKAGGNVAERWGVAPDDARNWASIPRMKRRVANLSHMFSQYIEPGARLGRVLSLCCGHGHFERTNLQLLSYDCCDALDISETALKHARDLAREAGILNVNYEQCDANALRLSHEYDFVFAGGIHHLSNLEHVFAEVARCLRPGAPFMMYEYVGPNRCQPTERQLEAINACIRLFPEKYRVKVSAQREMNVSSADEAMELLRRKRCQMRIPSDGDHVGQLSSDPQFAGFFWQRYSPVTAEEWLAIDPSESVRSQDIIPVLRRYFTEVDVRYQLGSIVQFALHDLAANFYEDSGEVNALLRMLINIEDVLTKYDPDIPYDYAVITARNPLGSFASFEAGVA